MNEWKDITSYSRLDEDRIPNTWELKLYSGERLVITRSHINMRDMPCPWLASFGGMFSQRNLVGIDRNSVQQAKDESIRLVKVLLKNLLNDLEDVKHES